MDIIKRILLVGMFFTCVSVTAQHSVARKWNEVLLEGIRNDFARPTIHARNLFHVSAAMYDAWAVFQPEASPYFLGQTVGDIHIPFGIFTYDSEDVPSLRDEAISYAVYHLMLHRFRNSPGNAHVRHLMDSLHTALGYDINFVDTDYSNGSAAALGVYIAEQIKDFGFRDGANELGSYGNLFYEPVNQPLNLTKGGDNNLKDPNRWQPLDFGGSFVDQSGNIINTGVIDFLSPEWGEVIPFSFHDSVRTLHQRGTDQYQVFEDPGGPPLIDTLNGTSWEDPYKWGFALVAIWSGHLDTKDGVEWDISPAGIGNLNFDNLPVEFNEYDQFYPLLEGGDPGQGYAINPKTNQPYEPQYVLRGDYARVLAEFWADGPESETPPGHWFVILNYVNDHPEFARKYEGKGEVVDPLEWDVKAYFTLAGAMHDAAVSAWSVKGYYDYIRPVSAIRYMATKGQSSDPDLPRYHKAGMPLMEGYIELVKEGDPLAGPNGENLNEVKLYAWRGHDYIADPEVDTAGVGWILATEWWPYQRLSFVTPPFSGYVSGHSTFSRAAAEVMTLLTGDAYFPGGMGEFEAPQNDYLVFEEGPTADVTLQWARYYDASDQCSLSRIWGGIHPPADDLNGRKMGQVIGKRAFQYAKNYFSGHVLGTREVTRYELKVFPNPTTGSVTISASGTVDLARFRIVDQLGRSWAAEDFLLELSEKGAVLDLSHFPKGIYHLSSAGGKAYRILVR